VHAYLGRTTKPVIKNTIYYGCDAIMLFINYRDTCILLHNNVAMRNNMVQTDDKN